MAGWSRRHFPTKKLFFINTPNAPVFPEDARRSWMNALHTSASRNHKNHCRLIFNRHWRKVQSDEKVSVWVSIGRLFGRFMPKRTTATNNVGRTDKKEEMDGWIDEIENGEQVPWLIDIKKFSFNQKSKRRCDVGSIRYLLVCFAICSTIDEMKRSECSINIRLFAELNTRQLKAKKASRRNSICSWKDLIMLISKATESANCQFLTIYCDEQMLIWYLSTGVCCACSHLIFDFQPRLLPSRKQQTHENWR